MQGSQFPHALGCIAGDKSLIRQLRGQDPVFGPVSLSRASGDLLGVNGSPATLCFEGAVGIEQLQGLFRL